MKREKLKELRISHGLTQEEIATELECSRGTYIATENGDSDPFPRFWKKLKEKFDIPEADMPKYQQKGGVVK